MHSTATYIARMLSPLSDAPDFTRRLAELRADQETIDRMEELAEKANEGLLSDEERIDYDNMIDATTVIAILRGKARQSMSGRTGS